MDELIDIVNENGEPTGKTALKSEVHRNGWFHNTTHVWLYTPEGQILLSQRAASKSIYPLLWDVSAAGHLDAGEDIVAGAIRETFEETGLRLKVEDLKSIGIHKHMSTYNNGSIKDYEFHHAFIAELKQDINTLVPQAGEVEAFKLVSFKDFSDLLEKSDENSHFVSTNRSYYKFVLASISNAIKN